MHELERSEEPSLYFSINNQFSQNLDFRIGLLLCTAEIPLFLIKTPSNDRRPSR